MCTDVYEWSGITLLSHMIGASLAITPTLIAYTLIQSPLISRDNLKRNIFTELIFIYKAGS